VRFLLPRCLFPDTIRADHLPRSDDGLLRRQNWASANIEFSGDARKPSGAAQDLPLQRHSRAQWNGSGCLEPEEDLIAVAICHVAVSFRLRGFGRVTVVHQNIAVPAHGVQEPRFSIVDNGDDDASDADFTIT
jgi:hypothetical protein